MSTTEKRIKARMGMLALAEQLNNISAACRQAGIRRSHYYEIKEAFEKFGSGGLAPRARRKPRMPNQTPPELEAQILEMTERYPSYSYLRISDQWKLIGIGVSPSTVRMVWQRHGLTLRIQRLLWLEQKAAASGGILTENQIRLLQKYRGRTADPEQHVEARIQATGCVRTPTSSAPSRASARSTCRAWLMPTAPWASARCICRRCR
jgi:hypothetical protein